MCRSPTGQRRSCWPLPVRLRSAPTVLIGSGQRNASGCQSGAGVADGVSVLFVLRH